MEEAARINRELGLPRLKPQSVNACLFNLAALMNYGEGLIVKSPARGLTVPITTRKKDRRIPSPLSSSGGSSGRRRLYTDLRRHWRIAMAAFGFRCSLPGPGCGSMSAASW